MQEKKYFCLVILLAMAASIAYGYLAFATAPKSGLRILNSPDEAANFYFATQLAENNKLIDFEPLNQFAGEIIHPRSIKALQGKLVPVSFIGLFVLYGMLGKVFGSWIIMYLTLIFSFFATLAFYKLIKEIFDSKIAFLSSVLLVFFPGWAYYNSRSMFHNVLFVDLLIIGLFFLYSFFQTKKVLSRTALASLSALFFGLALITRTSEIVWIAAILAVFLICFRDRIRMTDAVVFLAVLLFSFLPFFVFNKVAYGDFVAFGYQSSGLDAFENGLSSLSPETTDRQTVLSILKYFFPFGFHPRRSLVNFYNYYIRLFWWYFIPMVPGIGMYIVYWKQYSNKQKVYGISWLLITVYVLLFYGSWRIVDNLNPQAVTLGTSYVRYWLPIYVFSLPFCAIFLRRINKVSTIVLILMAVLTVRISWFTGDESVLAIRETLEHGYEKRQIVASFVKPDAIIVADRNDKTFFPEFRVINGFANQHVIENVAKLTDFYPMYYYTFLSDDDVKRVREELGEYGLELLEEKRIFRNERLFQVMRKGVGMSNE